jgi:hypothetical protein
MKGRPGGRPEGQFLKFRNSMYGIDEIPTVLYPYPVFSIPDQTDIVATAAGKTGMAGSQLLKIKMFQGIQQQRNFRFQLRFAG